MISTLEKNLFHRERRTTFLVWFIFRRWQCVSYVTSRCQAELYPGLAVKSQRLSELCHRLLLLTEPSILLAIDQGRTK
jgi:hypothetical protein